MKTLQKLTQLAFLFIALLVGTSAFAQQTQGQGRARLSAEERAAMQLERYQKQLDLTPDQATKIKAIVMASAQDMDKMRAAGTRPDRAAMQAEAQKRAVEINAILTPAQQEKFAKMLAEQMERQNNGGQGQGGGQRRQNSQGNQ
jgi:Spy/CpxP family protein refolding chaperone